MGRPKIPRVKVNCAVCGTEVEKYLSVVQRNKTGRFFCSVACRSSVPIRPITVPRRNCEWCGSEFVSYDKVGRFCSKACYDDWMRRDRVEKVCEGCGKTFMLKPSEAIYLTGRWCSRACEAASRIKRPLARTHNGKPAVLDRLGYVRVYQPDHPEATKGGWMSEHRLVAEETLGCRLEKGEHVHHINGVKHDNRPENLLVIGHGEHSSLTGLENGRRLREWEEYRRRYGPLP
jgi:hypothetical protein